jgi:hypothetical protein
VADRALAGEDGVFRGRGVWVWRCCSGVVECYRLDGAVGWGRGVVICWTATGRRVCHG